MSKVKTVLVVDDDAYIRRIIQLKLSKNGYHVLAAKNGQEGLDLITAEKPDVVISDINMPKIDGKSLCRITDKMKVDRKFLTIVLTARISQDERRWVDKLTDTLFMEKPFSPAKLIETINRYFKAT